MQKVATYYDFLKTRIKESYTINLKTGLKTGYFKHYKENGNGLLAEGMYNENNKTGKWVYYNPQSNGNEILLTENYNSKGQLHGPYSGRECNFGCAYVKGQFVNNKREGKFIQYRKGDMKTIEYIANFKNDVFNGEYLSYYQSGLLEKKLKYRNGELVDTAYEYIDSKIEPRLKAIYVYNNGEETVINKTSSDDKMLQTRQQVLSDVLEYVNSDAAFKRWKTKVDHAEEMGEYVTNSGETKQILLKAKNVSREDYDYVVDFIIRFFYSDYDDLCKSDSYFFFYDKDAEQAVPLIYKFMKLSNGLTNDFKEDLIWEIAGHKRCYPLEIDDKSPLIQQIRQSTLPDLDERKVVFSSPLAALWVIRKLLACTERNKNISDNDVSFIRLVFEANK
jgi:antitoxin component YwqK of YwqJK toxin-antitoxin module